MKLLSFKKFIAKNVVLYIAIFLAAITIFFVPPSLQYLDYFDFKTLTCLFCTLSVICALRNIHFFTYLAEKIIKITGNLRIAVIALVYITFIGSMFIANDMALLTFLPLGYLILSTTKNEKYTAFIFIMQNISANLGGMLTPFGNPQNLYLYSYYNISNVEFIKIMFLPFFVSVILITVCCLFIPSSSLKIEELNTNKPPLKRTLIYLALFILSIILVFRIIPYYIGLIVVPLILIIMDKSALKKVDYPLLFTFAVFFIFSGNLSRIDAVNRLLSFLLTKNTLLFSVLSCQFISNVPSAILLSKFTDDYPSLLMGVNIGGTGTLIASLASLITFRQYTSLYRERTASYIKLFSALNFSFLIILTVICSFIHF